METGREVGSRSTVYLTLRVNKPLQLCLVCSFAGSVLKHLVGKIHSLFNNCLCLTYVTLRPSSLSLCFV